MNQGSGKNILKSGIIVHRTKSKEHRISSVIFLSVREL
jgi:hypothetical protein